MPFPECPRWGYAGVSRLFERRLTPNGVDLVRSGAIQPSTLLAEASLCPEGVEACPSVPSALPAGTWADSEIGVYEPSRWSIGALSEAEIGRFPAAAQAVLRGKKPTTYNENNVFLFFPDFPESVGKTSGDGPDQVGCCFELTTAEVSAVVAALIDVGIPDPFVYPDTISVGQDLNLHLDPILPHGDPIAILG
jgi:hypothetical protein